MYWYVEFCQDFWIGTAIPLFTASICVGLKTLYSTYPGLLVFPVLFLIGIVLGFFFSCSPSARIWFKKMIEDCLYFPSKKHKRGASSCVQLDTNKDIAATTFQNNPLLSLSSVSSPLPSSSSPSSSPPHNTLSQGTIVMRGPDWKWGEQDGGRGKIGTVKEVVGFGYVEVVWEETGRDCLYVYDQWRKEVVAVAEI